MKSGTLVGTACQPFASESTLGVLLRLASWNMLPLKHVLSLLGRTSGSLHDFDLYGMDRPSDGAWGELGWQWCSPEPRLLSSLSGLRSVIWSAQLRFCPVCMCRGFHSIWFQLSALAACPLHGCPLQDRCVNCGAVPGLYRVTKRLFSNPYICADCGVPFSGTRCNLREQTEFFRQSEAVDAVFAPLRHWLLYAAPQLLFLDVPNRKRRHTCFSTIKARTLAGAIRLITPYPRMYALTDGQAVTLRSWDIRLARPRRCEVPIKRELLSWGAVRMAYLATIRLLTRLVSKRAPATGAPGYLEFDGQDMAALSGWRTERLALIMLRRSFEEPYFLSWNAPLQGIVLRDYAFAPAMIGNSRLRVACRAFVVAAFRGIYDLSKQYIADGYLRRPDFICSPDDLAVLAGCVSDGIQHGVIVLPADILVDSFFPRSGNATSIATISRINETLSIIGAD